MVMVEVIDGFIMINQAELVPNRVPLKTSIGSLVQNVHGNFFGSSLEATFSIHESVLNACKEWTVR